MPPPIKVDLFAHDPSWSCLANAEAKRLSAIMGPNLKMVHHVGSTAIPGIRAKPILDLIPVVESLAELDIRQGALEASDYEWWGELGLPGRRYCTKTDKESGRRAVQLHCYLLGSPEITRHLAFRDYLRSHPALAAEYDRVKAACQRLHSHNSHAYGDCKEAWIRDTELQAVYWFHSVK